MTEQKRISAQDAAQNAMKYYQQLSGDYNNSTIEEIELSEDGKEWLITLGIRVSTSTAVMIYAQMEKSYKIFRIDAENGDVLSMKIRTV